MTNTLGIHHITAVASDPKECVDFYGRVLGLRLVKKSVNQDQVEAYHLFFGDSTGEPGMDLTFFTFPGAVRGELGAGAVSMISLAVPFSSFDYWLERFEKEKVKNEGLEERQGHQRVVFYDGDGQRLELVSLSDVEYTAAAGTVWSTDEVPEEHAIGCFHSARLSVLSKEMVDAVLTEVLGFTETLTDGITHIYELDGVGRAGRLEVTEHPMEEVARQGAGTVHHIAFQVRDEEHLRERREVVKGLGLYPTDVIDRYYFESVYFRTPAGILFELATNGPGFTVDEEMDHLGEKLALPPFLEPQRVHIESLLEPL